MIHSNPSVKVEGGHPSFCFILNCSNVWCQVTGGLAVAARSQVKPIPPQWVNDVELDEFGCAIVG